MRMAGSSRCTPEHSARAAESTPDKGPVHRERGAVETAHGIGGAHALAALHSCAWGAAVVKLRPAIADRQSRSKCSRPDLVLQQRFSYTLAVRQTHVHVSTETRTGCWLTKERIDVYEAGEMDRGS